MFYDFFKSSGNLRKSSEVFGNIRKSSEIFGSVRKSSKVFGNLRKRFTDVIGNIPNVSQELKGFGAGF